MNQWLKKLGLRHLIYIQIVLSIFFLIHLYYQLPDRVIEKIRKEIKAQPGSLFYDVWKKPPIFVYAKFHLFNLTNMDDWLEGRDAKPKMQETGPYVYLDVMQKSNIEFQLQNDTVEYDLDRHYYFLPRMSNGSLDDILIVPNIILISLAVALKDVSSLALMAIRTMYPNLDQEPLFERRTVREMIWGFPHPLVDIVANFMPPEAFKVPGKFGFFAGLNETSHGRYKILVGLNNRNRNKANEVIEFNGQKAFNAWKTEECNAVKGRNGGSYRSPLTKEENLDIFVPDICRKIDMIPTARTDVINGIKAWHYVADPKMFDYSVKENNCYCMKSGRDETFSDDFNFDQFTPIGTTNFEGKQNIGKSCNGKGLFDIGPCQFGAPMAISWPHFYDADKNYLQAVDGLNPERKKHEFNFYVEPTLGLAVSAKIRLQMNLLLERNHQIEPFKKLPDNILTSQLAYPIFWVENEIEELPKNLAFLLKEVMSIGPRLATAIACLGFSLLAIESVILVGYLRWKRLYNSAI